MGHFTQNYRLKTNSPPFSSSSRTHLNVVNAPDIGSAAEKAQMEVIVSPPPVSTYTLPRGLESPPDTQSIMYSSRSGIDTTSNPSQIQIKTEHDAINFSSSRSFKGTRKEVPLSTRFQGNGTRAPTDYTLHSKFPFDHHRFSMPPLEKKGGVAGRVNTGDGGNPFDQVLERSVESLMKFAEILYKCTLCTTLPSILTSRDSFISHVNDLHLTKKLSHKDCLHCNLVFSTEEDLRAHCRISHSAEVSPDEDNEPTEPSPIDEFTNNSEMDINTENQCTIADPTKSIKNRSTRVLFEPIHSKQRQNSVIAPGPLFRVSNNSSPGKEGLKSEKITIEENMTRLQQLADQILISNSRLSNGGVGGAPTGGGGPSGFHGATSNPSYTPDFGKYTKLIREGGNIVYFCQVCNCKCQARAGFMNHCSSYQHRARVEAADRSVTSDPQQTPANASTQQQPPPAHSHTHTQRHLQNTHPSYHQQQQQSHQHLLSRTNYKLITPTENSTNSLSNNITNSPNISISHKNYSVSSGTTNSSNKKLVNHSSNSPLTQTTPTTPSRGANPSLTNSSINLTTPTINNSNSNDKNRKTTTPPLPVSPLAPSSPTVVGTTSKSTLEDCSSSGASPSGAKPVQAGSSPVPTSSPISPTLTQEGSSKLATPVSDPEVEQEAQRICTRIDAPSDLDMNCDKEVSCPRQRRKRHAPVAVRQHRITTTWSDSDSEPDEAQPIKYKKLTSVEGADPEALADTSQSNINLTDNSQNGSSSASSTTTTSTLVDNINTNQSSSECINKSLEIEKDKNLPENVTSSQGSPQNSPVPAPLKTLQDTPPESNDTPVDFSMTDSDSVGSLRPTDSLGVQSKAGSTSFPGSKEQPNIGYMSPLVTIKSEPEEKGADNESAAVRGVYRCSFCDFVCNDIRDYEEHFIKEHDPDLLDVTLTDSMGKTVHGEYWKMLKIKDILPELLVGCAKGYVSRDILLQKISHLLHIPEVIHWGPACNKAVREEFPNSLAQRKGKFKKTYYFGVVLIEQLQEQEELSDSENVTYQPLRDLAQDLEKILQFLPELVFWTGDLDVGISRDEVLQLLGEKIEESGVQYWGVQCNRAMRFLFPSIHMKRKGKFKTTVYFGVDFMKNITRQTTVYFGVDFMKNITRQIPQTFESDPTMFIKTEPQDDSYESSEAKMALGEMTSAIFPTSVPVTSTTSSTSLSTAATPQIPSTGTEENKS